MAEIKTVEEAQAIIESQAKQIEDLTRSHSEKDETIAKLKASDKEKAALIKSLRKESAVVNKFPTFKKDGKEYEVIVPKAKFKGEEITAEGICKDESLQDELIEMSASIIREIEK